MDAPTISKIYRSFLRGDLSITFSIDNTIIREIDETLPDVTITDLPELLSYV